MYWAWVPPSFIGSKIPGLELEEQGEDTPVALSAFPRAHGFPKQASEIIFNIFFDQDRRADPLAFAPDHRLGNLWIFTSLVDRYKI
jgi:hypothetical protein